MPSVLAFLVVLALPTITVCSAVPTLKGLQFLVSNPAYGTDGGRRFDHDTGRNVAVEIMRNGTKFIWDVFDQQLPAQGMNIRNISLLVESMGGNVEKPAYTVNHQIHLSADYVGKYTGDLRREIAGILYHELTYVWLWNGEGNDSNWIKEGIANYVRLKAKLVPSNWVKPGGGNRWNQSGSGVTARFFQYCESVLPGVLLRLIVKIATWRLRGTPRIFASHLGRPLDDLWKAYKAGSGCGALSPILPPSSTVVVSPILPPSSTVVVNAPTSPRCHVIIILIILLHC